MKLRFLLGCLLLIFVAHAAAVSAQDAQSLLAQASQAYGQKEFEKSAQLYAAAVRAGAQDPRTLYNAACSFALAGKKDEAFKYLELAVANGYGNAAHMKTDSDLNSLHEDARWQRLIDNAAANAKAADAFWNNPALRTPFRESLSEEEKVAGLSKLWSEAKFNFANFDLAGDLDWDALYLAYLPRVRQAKTTEGYYRLLMEFFAKLKDGHTNVAPPRELFDRMLARPLVRTRLVEDRVVIVAVTGEALRREGLAPGQEILEIDGQPVRQYAEQRVMPLQAASTKQDLESRIYDYWLLSGPAQTPVELTLKDARGNVFKKSLPRIGYEERRKYSTPLQPMEFKLLPGNIAYVALNSFENDKTAEMFEAAFSSIAQADALIIDVRDNGGGSSSVGWKVLSFLTDKPFKVSKWRTRNYRPTYRAWGYPEGRYGEESGDQPPDGKRLYKKPVVVLTSPRTFSAAEDFMVAFDMMERGPIIGEPTGGSTGQPLIFYLPGGGSARVCTKRDMYPDGREFVGVGIQPDRLVRPTLEDVRAGRDTVLEAALAELKKQR